MVFQVAELDLHKREYQGSTTVPLGNVECSCLHSVGLWGPNECLEDTFVDQVGTFLKHSHSTHPNRRSEFAFRSVCRNRSNIRQSRSSTVLGGKYGGTNHSIRQSDIQILKLPRTGESATTSGIRQDSKSIAEYSAQNRNRILCPTDNVDIERIGILHRRDRKPSPEHIDVRLARDRECKSSLLHRNRSCCRKRSV